MQGKKVERSIRTNEVELARKVESRTSKKFWQWVKHAWLYTDLLKAGYKGEPLIVRGSQQREPEFLHLQFPTAETELRQSIQL